MYATGDAGSRCTIAREQGRFKPVPFDSIMDPQTGRMRVRMVDIDSDRYRIAYAYMLRLKRADFDDPGELAKLAAVAHTTPEGFRALLGHLVEVDVPSIAPAGLSIS